MASILKPKRRTADATAPTTANLADGEVAINIPGKTIYINNAGTIVPIANWFSGAWTDVSGKPTTLDGYGITDAPTKTGTGASGTWGISITGNAATAANATQLNGQAASYYRNASNLNAGTISDSRLPTAMANKNLTGTTVSEFLVQGQHGKPRTNLGSPTITEMALFELQFDNKLWFYPDNLLTFESTSDGVNWTTETVTQNQVQRLVAGKGSTGGASVQIPRTAQQYRITITNRNSYVYLNALYSYFSTSGNTCAFEIWKKRNDGEWVQHTSDPTQVGSWPGHLYLPFTNIAWSQQTKTGHYNDVRIVITPVWNSSNTNTITLYGLQLWGGYPAGTRTIYNWDEFRNVTFPADVTASELRASTLYEGGIQLDQKYAVSSHPHAIDDVTGLQPALDGKAPLASPALTGAPTAPTATAGTNNTQIATTAFVTAAVEDAGGITDAPSDGTTYGRKDAGWVSISSGGISDAPSDGKYYGRKDGAWEQVGQPGVVNVTANTTLSTSHLNKVVEVTVAGLITITIPSGLGAQGDMITVVHSHNTGNVNIARGSGVAIYRYSSNSDQTITHTGMMTFYRTGTTDTWLAA